MNDQRGTLDQLNDLYKLAIEHGLYDAADWMKLRVAEIPLDSDILAEWENK